MLRIHISPHTFKQAQEDCCAPMQTEKTGFVTNSEVFDCPICFCETEVGEGVMLSGCLHQFCKWAKELLINTRGNSTFMLVEVTVHVNHPPYFPLGSAVLILSFTVGRQRYSVHSKTMNTHTMLSSQRGIYRG